MSMVKTDLFIHDFKSCSRTYSTLSIYHSSADPHLITDILQIVPDRTNLAGEKLASKRISKNSGWFLSTLDKVDSKDLRAHLEYLLQIVIPKVEQIKELIASEYKLAIWCFWESANGNGGPIIDHELMKSLSLVPIDLYFDIYFPGRN